MEMFQAQGAYQGTCKTRSDYIRIFEHIIPEVLREHDPDTFYWPASPSSGGGFDAPNDEHRGDVHYWEVWHGSQPFHAYRQHYFRYVSEFGFQAFPGIRTVEAFTLPWERNIFSRVMEMHQRNEGANGKIIHYLSQTYLYPLDLETLLYASQLLQAEAIQYGVEHWRRHRGRCMGAIYWQLNDIWPVASWASIDSFGRWKALHYFAKHFFAPVMISCEEKGETTDRASVVMQPSEIKTSAWLCVANETRARVSGEVCWQLRDEYAGILREGRQPLEVAALSSAWLEELDFSGIDFLRTYFSFAFMMDGEIVSQGCALFTAPKHFRFADPRLAWRVQGDTITIAAQAFARCVQVEAADGDLLLSDNYFDMHAGTKRIRVLEGRADGLRVRSVFDIGRIR
jgi:beta-mannosidase